MDRDLEYYRSKIEALKKQQPSEYRDSDAMILLAELLLELLIEV